MTTALLLFGMSLLLAVIFSGIAERTALSTAVIFLVMGFLAGEDAIGLVHLSLTDSEYLYTFVEVALIAILFTDGMKIGRKDLLEVWELPSRALLFGMPLTFLIFALLARFLLGLTWLEAFLVAAVLSPTDPVFSAAIVSRQEVPVRLRRLLNVESGINDGIALPVVLTIFALLGVEELKVFQWVGELVLGVGLGVVIPWSILLLKNKGWFSISELYAPLVGLAIGLLTLSLAELLHANTFLAAFSAGVTIATMDSHVRDLFLSYGEHVSELLKLGGVLLFGTFLTFEAFTQVNPLIYLFAFLALMLARPIAIGIALIGSSTDWRERLVAGWFGPRGFASVVYGLLVLGSGIPRARELFFTIAVVITGSILMHSSTDALVARWFERLEEGPEKSREKREKEEVSV